jgi:hypothetical protein
MKIFVILASAISSTVKRFALLIILIVIGTGASVAQRITIIPKAGLALSSVRNHPGIFDSPVRGLYLTPVTHPMGYGIVGDWRWGLDNSSPVSGFPMLMPPVDEDKFTEVEDQHIRLKGGFTVGAAVNIAFSDYFSLQPEINFVQKGLSVHYSNYSVMQFQVAVGVLAPRIAARTWGEGNMTVYCFDVPVLAKYTFRTHPSWAKFFVVAGPSVSVGLGGRMKSKENFGFVSVEDPGSLTPGISIIESHNEREGNIAYEDGMFTYQGQGLVINKRVTFGAQVGGGALLFDTLSVDIRYGTDFTSLYDRYSNAYSQTFQATVGFPLVLN